MVRLALVLLLVAATVAVSGKTIVGDPCTTPLPFVFTNEKGNLTLSWLIDNDSIQMEVSLPGTAFMGIGFGIGMVNTDMVISWVYDNGTVYSDDYYSTAYAPPNLDITLGGTDDVAPLCGSQNNGMVSVRFQRKLNTGDKYDFVLNTSVIDMIYAWGSGDPGNLHYHGDNHNHIQIDLTQLNGVPNNQFGEEETGLAARQLVNNNTAGVLITLQSEPNAGGPGMQGYPYGSVAGFADEDPSTGRPLLLLSQLERNIINMNEDNRVSLAIYTQPSTQPDAPDVMTQPRTTLMGSLDLVPQSELAQAQKTYLAKHPEASYWINFSDFSMYRMNISDVYFVGGFGNVHYIGWITPEEYLSHTL